MKTLAGFEELVSIVSSLAMKGCLFSRRIACLVGRN